ncbi:Ger(x)C family spore germination protein [Alteribacter natronophilus]|uniref:Ger(x)C family spore germination protein n=1 Tax=Alteribacter natronophilus TaxID=2583810 RepID=UPI00110D90AF|nr:Ger(x)C family spore germination protein [Alteribacter natronophilus]TMW73906.1 Ger(x)C family spore germination protein [Alteribacter natronophilus]
MKRLIPLSLAILLLLSGCWDSRQLRDITIAKSAALDLLDDGIYQSTISSPVPRKYQAEERTLVVSGTGHTIREARMALDGKVSEQIDTAKLRILVLGEPLARKNIFPPLDIMYRDPRSSLGAKIAVFDGVGSNLIHMKLTDKPRTSEFVAELLETAESNTIVDDINVQLICPIMMDPGEDMILPYIGVDEEDNPRLIGNALFNGDTMTGSLSVEDSTLLLLMKGKLGSATFLTEKVHQEEEEDDKDNYITLRIRDTAASTEVTVNHASDEVTANVKLTMKVEAIEYPHNELTEKENIAKLNTSLEEQFTAEAGEIFKTLQESNCDALGIGRRVLVHHPDFWDTHKWNELYPEITIEPEIKVEIVDHGIIN